MLWIPNFSIAIFANATTFIPGLEGTRSRVTGALHVSTKGPGGQCPGGPWGALGISGVVQVLIPFRVARVQAGQPNGRTISKKIAA